MLKKKKGSNFRKLRNTFCATMILKSSDWLHTQKTDFYIMIIRSFVYPKYGIILTCGDRLTWHGRNTWQLEIDRYIGLPIFFPIFKHFTIIGFEKKKYRFWFFFFFFFFLSSHTSLYRAGYNQQWNLFSAFDPSKCTHTHLEQWTLFTQEKLQHNHRM